jgi:sulfur-oxidizing protein SoxY
MNRHGQRGATRRDVLKAAGALAAGASTATLLAAPANSTPAAMQGAIRRVIGEASVKPGKVTLDIPPLVENGNTVPCAVVVESPMTATNHVKAIHIFNEKNPQPNVITMRLGARAGRASVSTRIRLSDTQTVVAIAELSDGSFWSASTNVIITLGACLED